MSLYQGHGEREGKALAVSYPEQDVYIYQNAKPTPSNLSVPEQVAKMFELNQRMDPLQVSIVSMARKQGKKS